MREGAGARSAPGRRTRACSQAGRCNGHAGAAETGADARARLSRRVVRLVYGGGNVGLMGEVARACVGAGGEVVGIIPRALMPREVSGEAEHLGRQVCVETMHERKAMLSDEADAFISLPGGYGTLEELTEMLTFAQLGIHDKAVSVLNVCGYYDKLLAFFDQAVEEGFVRQRTRSLLMSDADVEALLDKLTAYKHDQAGALLPAASWRATPKEAKALAR